MGCALPQSGAATRTVELVVSSLIVPAAVGYVMPSDRHRYENRHGR